MSNWRQKIEDARTLPDTPYNRGVIQGYEMQLMWEEAGKPPIYTFQPYIEKLKSQRSALLFESRYHMADPAMYAVYVTELAEIASDLEKAGVTV